jgi:hypothetical protein
VERAVDLLKAEEADQGLGKGEGMRGSPPGSPGSPGKKKRGGKDKKKRSPLRRSHSNFDGVGGSEG